MKKIYKILIITLIICNIYSLYSISKLKHNLSILENTTLDNYKNIKSKITLLENTSLKTNFIDNSITQNSIFENPPTDGVNPISQEDAKIAWEKYRKEIVCGEPEDYAINKIEIENVIPNNYLESNESMQTATFYRKAYVFYCSMDNNNLFVNGYVDMYTGKVIGGNIHGI